MLLPAEKEYYAGPGELSGWGQEIVKNLSGVQIANKGRSGRGGQRQQRTGSDRGPVPPKVKGGGQECPPHTTGHFYLTSPQAEPR